ncbi:MAG: chlorite dismutase family protein [Polyangiaceae bacterium]
MAAIDPNFSPDVMEHGAERDGKPQEMNNRLFMQLLAFESDAPELSIQQIGAALDEAGARAVIYQDVNHAQGLAVLSFSDEPADFVKRTRAGISKVSGLRARPELSMLGRTYSTGYEPDLEYWLLRRPAETVKNADWPWAVWYPLRRSGAFEKLEPRERGGILREHATIGKAYGHADLAHDIRLACHGLDANDNEFVIGLVGKELHPLSHVVQSMRGTRQTSEFIVQMGPFFVGYAVWHSRA